MGHSKRIVLITAKLSREPYYKAADINKFHRFAEFFIYAYTDSEALLA